MAPLVNVAAAAAIFLHAVPSYCFSVLASPESTARSPVAGVDGNAVAAIFAPAVAAEG
jgi:hypothetical protein